MLLIDTISLGWLTLLNRKHSCKLLNSYYACLFADEIKRERDFYRARNLPCPKDAALAADKPGADEPEQPDNTDCHRKDEQVIIN